MRKSLFDFSLFTLSLLILLGCAESFEERCQREAREYTEQHCPRMVDKSMRLDSMVYEQEPQGFAYYYSIIGEMDNEDLITPQVMAEYQEQMLEKLRQDINLKRYKEHGFTFSYRYFSGSTGENLLDVSFGPEDYGE